jgi:hypothetical protein
LRRAAGARQHRVVLGEINRQQRHRAALE